MNIFVIFPEHAIKFYHCIIVSLLKCSKRAKRTAPDIFCLLKPRWGKLKQTMKPFHHSFLKGKKPFDRAWFLERLERCGDSWINVQLLINFSKSKLNQVQSQGNSMWYKVSKSVYSPKKRVNSYLFCLQT